VARHDDKGGDASHVADDAIHDDFDCYDFKPCVFLLQFKSPSDREMVASVARAIFSLSQIELRFLLQLSVHLPF
jgi:hypothetical protein